MNKKQMKYARFEYERRFKLPALPKKLIGSEKYKLIEDRYFAGTNLRLRVITDSKGEILQQKLTQKFIPKGLDPSRTLITNIYLSENDIKIFKDLPGSVIKKKRYDLNRRQYRYSVDEFIAPRSDLVFAELEFETEDDMMRYSCPYEDWTEVTQDLEFTGGEIAFGKSPK